MSNNFDSANCTPDSQVMKPTRPTEIARLKVSQLTLESGNSLLGVFREACRVSAATLNVERVGVWLMYEDQSALRCAALFEASHGEFRDGSILQAADFPTYFAALTQRKIVPAEMAQRDPLTAELSESYLKPLNIASILDAPILIAGEVSGVLCCEHLGESREWSTEERDFVASIADILAIKMRGAEIHQLRGLIQSSEKRILASEKSDALARMALGVAHDFRNILTVVQNCAELIQTSECTANAKELSGLILDAAERGTETVRALADFGREGPVQPTVIDPVEEIQSFEPIIRAALTSAYPINFQLQQNIGKVLIDRNQFQRILLNLVLNAKDASPQGGSIDIKTYRKSSADYHPQDRLVIEVSDRGNGIEEAMLTRIFEPFFTTKEGGSGLGLPIVSRIIERAGGSVEVDSKLGFGSTFRLIFPIVSH